MSILRKIVEKKKVERYAWPDGWMTREQAANDLGVAPRDVDDELRDAIRDGDVLKEHFSMYCPKQKKVVRMPGYKVAGKDEQAAETKAKPQSAKPASVDERIIASIHRNPKAPDHQIAKNLSGVTSADVARVRSTL